MNGLPLLKPPYGHLTAIDLNRGEIAWRVPVGDTPSLRSHAGAERRRAARTSRRFGRARRDRHRRRHSCSLAAGTSASTPSTR